MDTAVDSGIYSCDDHLDLRAVPPALWQDRLPAADVERGPRVIERDGDLVWVCEGRDLGGSGYVGPTGERIRALNAIGRAGIDDDGYRAGNARLRLEDLDLDGLAASVVYGPLAIGLPIEDPALQAVCFAAWNDWAADDFNAVAPDRLMTLPFLPSNSAQVAADELERCAAKGHRGAIIDVFDMDLGDPEWDRLWSVAQDTGLPISVHIKGGSWSGLSYQIGKWQAAAFATIMPLQLDEILATLIFSGVLERHPGLQIVMAESGVSWLPFFLARADMEWNALKGKLDYAPELSPSELFARQVFATFEEEFHPEQIPVLGAERCMWASDYPHTDSTFPESRRVIDETLGGLSDDDRRKVTATNCAQLYRFAGHVTGAISGFDHVSLPLRDEDAMAAFYRAIGASVDELEHVVVVHLGDQMINFHRAEMWTRADFTLRAPGAVPPCGDFCLRWVGSGPELDALLADAGIAVEEGPVPRRGARGTEATSVYVRDPDGNLVEFMRYP